MTTSFAKDIAPMFKGFKAPMTWRFDLTLYEHVQPNAQMIYARISSSDAPMPPPPYPPLTQKQIELFKVWMDEGTPP